MSSYHLQSKLEKLIKVLKTREDNYLDIISGLTSASHLLKSTCKSLFQGTSLIYQNLTLMIEDDMNSLMLNFDKLNLCLGTKICMWILASGLQK